jgi:hypothetical protein
MSYYLLQREGGEPYAMNLSLSEDEARRYEGQLVLKGLYKGRRRRVLGRVLGPVGMAGLLVH